jgi:AcrR family transcriptional regulator
VRITLEDKTATRRRIVESAVNLFRKRGFDATTTRDVARAAGIATGTLFNYFDTKEAIVRQLAEDALRKARAALDGRPREADLEEDLFALVAAELRQLKPLRKFIIPLLETVLSPLAIARNDRADGSLRVEHLEIVAEIARTHGIAELPPTSMQVYWALYTGVLAFWSSDKSPRQEDTLALLDQSLEMFTGWLRTAAGEPQ